MLFIEKIAAAPPLARKITSSINHFTGSMPNMMKSLRNGVEKTTDMMNSESRRTLGQNVWNKYIVGKVNGLSNMVTGKDIMREKFVTQGDDLINNTKRLTKGMASAFGMDPISRAKRNMYKEMYSNQNPNNPEVVNPYARS
jgi:hypothetical protein